MKRWITTAAAALSLILLYLACQGSAESRPAESPDVPPPPQFQGETVEAGKAEALPPAQETLVVDTAKKPPAEGEQQKAEPEDEAKEKGEPSATEVSFAENAFPPTVSDTEYHKNAWYRDDCLRCHETGVEEATVIRHENLPAILLQAKCRSCHVLTPGQAPVEPKRTEDEKRFAEGAFPPMIPASDSHRNAWRDDNCLLCHETGVRGAPIIKHQGLPKVLLEAKCRSCHVQVRSASISGP